MKKLMIAAFAVILFSCNCEPSTTNDTQASLIGHWGISQTFTAGNVVHPSESEYHTLVFKQDSTFIKREFSANGNVTEQGRYTLLQGNLIFINNNNDSLVANVVHLTANTLALQTNVEINGEVIPKRQSYNAIP